VQALDDEDGTAGDWIVTALAICATPPPGLERVAASSALDSSGKSVAAS
jgi:hypothetical protein